MMDAVYDAHAKYIRARHILSTSVIDNQLVVPRTLTSTFGLRAFSTSGRAAWNALSSELRDPSISLNCFRHSLKMYLYKR